MGITANRFNDPALGQAFSNLSSLFAPPSGGDLSGYASAAATKEKAAMLADLFGTPGATPSQKAALIGVQGYGQTPDGFGMTDATDRRGQDITAATSRANNADDNAGALARMYAAPVILGEGQTAYLPGQTQAATGLPGMFTGAVSADPGERVTLPDGRVIAGADKPLTDAEFNAIVLQGLPRDMQVANAMGSTPVESVLGPDGKPTLSYRPNAVGQAPAPTGAVETQNYRTPDDQRGTAMFVGNEWRDTQTGQPIPDGSVTFNASLQGGAETGLGPTTANATDWNKQVYEADYALSRIDTFSKLLGDNPGALGVSGTIQGFIQSAQQGVSELAAIYGDDTNVQNLEDLTAMVAEAARTQQWNPAIAQARLMALEMAYMEIKSQDPSGEVNVRELERVLPSFNGGFAGNQPVLDVLQITRQRVETRRKLAAEALARGGSPGNPGATPPPGGDMPKVSTPEEARLLPSGTRFLDPQGNVRVVP